MAMPPLSVVLRSRQFGGTSKWQFSSHVVRKRLLSLDINSKFEIFHPVFEGEVNSLDIEEHDGRYMLAGYGDGSIALFDLLQTTEFGPRDVQMCNVVSSTQGKSTKFSHRFSLETATWFPHDTGMFITSGMDHYLKIWDTNAWTVAEEFKFDTPVYSHAVSPGSAHNLIAIARREHNIKLYNMETGSTSQILRGHKNSVLSLAWSPRNEHHLISGGADGKMFLWDIRQAKSMLLAFDQHNGRQEFTFEGKLAHTGFVNGIKFTHDGLYVVSVGTDKQLRVWDAGSGDNTLVNFGWLDCKSRKSVQMAMAHDSDKKLVFVPSGLSVECFDLSTGHKLHTLSGHYGKCGTCVLRPDRQEVFSGAKDARILWFSPPEPRKCVQVEMPKEHEPVVPPPAKMPAALQDAWSSDEDGS